MYHMKPPKTRPKKAKSKQNFLHSKAPSSHLGKQAALKTDNSKVPKRPPVSAKQGVLHGAAPGRSAKPHEAVAKPQKASKGTGLLPTAKQLKAASLPPPATMKPGSAEYVAAEKEWYGKLEADGFDDLEYTVRSDGSKGHNSDYLKGSGIRGRTWSPEKAQFYRLLQNYLTHHAFRDMQKRYVMHSLNDGLTYRQILAGCKQKYGLKRSLYWFYYYVQELVQHMITWNTKHEEGILNPKNQDSWATDALLSDLSGTAGVIEAPNGLKLDAGWWGDNAMEWWRANHWGKH